VILPSTWENDKKIMVKKANLINFKIVPTNPKDEKSNQRLPALK